ncbi:MAG: methyltransferase domain-containing protein [Patescibacteria group bacterium]
MFVRPKQIIHTIGIEPGMVVADFGSGSGHYIIPVAKIVGIYGVVYAIDVQKDLLSAIKSNAELNNLNNVRIIWGDLEKEKGSHLADQSVNVVIISNILFQVEDKEAIAKEAFRVLKDGGRAFIIEWDEKFLRIGPPKEQRIKKEDCLELFEKIGFEKIEDVNVGENHYGIIFIKRRS